MNLTTKLLSAVAATTLTAAALTFTTTIPADASWASADACAAANGGDRDMMYVDEDYGWDCSFPSFPGDPSFDSKVASLRTGCDADRGTFSLLGYDWFGRFVVNCDWWV